MNQTSAADPRLTRFRAAVQAFTPICATRYAKLLPFQEGITELRQKGASYRLIRELLATVDVPVAVDTIGQFVREVIEQRPPERPTARKRPVRPLSEPSTARHLPTPSKPQFPFTVAPPLEETSEQVPPQRPPQESPATVPSERTRTRGPRIADPANL